MNEKKLLVLLLWSAEEDIPRTHVAEMMELVQEDYIDEVKDRLTPKGERTIQYAVKKAGEI